MRGGMRLRTREAWEVKRREERRRVVAIVGVLGSCGNVKEMGIEVKSLNGSIA